MQMPPPPPVVVEPSEADISTLERMGFDREPAVAALRRANNSVEVATNALLDG